MNFLQVIETRFAHSPYEDPTGILFKLTLKGSVNDYLSKFEVLTNRIVGLPPPFLLSCFISELDLDIRHEVQACQPLTLIHAAGLARLQEEKLMEHHHDPRGRTYMEPISHPPSNLLTSPLPPTLPLLPSPAKPPPLPLRRLTLEEMASWRERGLCFNCDAKFTRGHKCASRFFLLIVDEEREAEDADPKIEIPSLKSDDPP